MNTIVGSGPVRKPLPYGQEAVERAIRMCEFWSADDPQHASSEAWERRRAPHRGLSLRDSLCTEDPLPSWLPYELRVVSLKRLRGLLRGMQPRVTP